MNKKTKIAILIAGVSTAVGALAIYIYRKNHKVDVVEQPPLSSFYDDEKSQPGIPVVEAEPKDIIAENYNEEIVEVAKPKYDIPPYQIGQEAFLSNDPSYEKVVLWWDSQLDVFANELEYIEYDIFTKLGEENVKRFKADDSMTFMYIRNENLEKDYELVK